MTEFYLDANAGLPARVEAVEAWVQVARAASANPASLHRPGRRAQGELERAREEVAASLRCASRELVFTSGATEACNLALLGMVRAQAAFLGRPLRLLSSRAEHPAVLGPLRALQHEGHALTLLPIDAHARVSAEALTRALLEDRFDLVALQWANNETGAMQPIEALASALPMGALWFCDSVQGFGKLAWDPALERADALVVSGHKFRAPHGVGAWVLREHAPFEAPLSGGGHQAGRRPGTENPELASALAIALRLAEEELPAVQTRWEHARTQLLDTLRAAFPEVIPHHPEQGCLPNTINLGFPQVDGRMLLPALDAEGFAVSAGSACSSGSPEPSAVLLAAGVSEDLARASLRISLPPDLDVENWPDACARLATTIARVYEVANR